MFRPLSVLLPVTLVLVIIAACGGGGGSSPPPPVERVGRIPVIGEIKINEFLADPATDANCDGTFNMIQDEFVELVSTATDTLDLSYVTIWYATTMKHAFPRGAYLRPQNAAVVYGGGAPNCTVPAGVPISVASTGGLGLKNTLGETIIVKNETGTVIDSASYVNATNDISFNRSPDVTGDFALHTAVPGAVGNYSPATRVTGSAFP